MKPDYKHEAGRWLGKKFLCFVTGMDIGNRRA